MLPTNASETLLDAVAAGDQSAVERLIECLDPHLRMVVRKRLPQLLRRRFDSDDFVQAVWASFLTEEKFDEHLNDAAQLRRYLAGAAKNKVLMAVRGHIQTAARDMKLDVSIHPGSEGEASEFIVQLASDEAGPASKTLATDLRENRTADLNDDLKRVLAMREEGFTTREIAAEMQLSTRSVERALAKLRANFR